MKARARRALARVASEKASSPTPLGLAPERQSGLRALIIARRLVGRRCREIPPHFSRVLRYPVRVFVSVAPVRTRRWCRQLGKADPHSVSVDSHRGREEEPPHGLSLRVAALQHSRLPRPFRGAGTPRSIYTHVTHAHVSTDHPYTRGRRVHTALNPDGDFSTPTPPREVWG